MRLRGCAAGGSCCALSDPKRRRHGLPKHLPADVLHAVQNSTKLTHKEVTSLYERFRQLAPSGEMSLIVFRGTMGMLGMLDDSFLSHRMFSAFDANKDGRVSFGCKNCVVGALGLLYVYFFLLAFSLILWSFLSLWVP